MSYNMSGTLGSADADIQVSLNPGHGPTEHYMKELRQHLPERFPGLTFYFLPADIVSQILNFGLPAPIDVQVVGRNIQANRAFTLGLFQKLKQVDGIADLPAPHPPAHPRLHTNLDSPPPQPAPFSPTAVPSNPPLP